MELGVDPVRDLAQIAKNSSNEYDKLVELANDTTDPEIQAEMLKVVNDAKKIQIRTLRELSSICEKEDDQAIKLMDHGLKREEFEHKKEKFEQQSQDTGERQIVYAAPVYKRIEGKDGKVKLIREEVMVEQSAED